MALAVSKSTIINVMIFHQQKMMGEKVKDFYSETMICNSFHKASVSQQRKPHAVPHRYDFMHTYFS